jgi:hypothetical protein
MSFRSAPRADRQQQQQQTVPYSVAPETDRPRAWKVGASEAPLTDLGAGAGAGAGAGGDEDTYTYAYGSDEEAENIAVLLGSTRFGLSGGWFFKKDPHQDQASNDLRNLKDRDIRRQRISILETSGVRDGEQRERIDGRVHLLKLLSLDIFVSLYGGFRGPSRDALTANFEKQDPTRNRAKIPAAPAPSKKGDDVVSISSDSTVEDPAQKKWIGHRLSTHAHVDDVFYSGDPTRVTERGVTAKSVPGSLADTPIRRGTADRSRDRPPPSARRPQTSQWENPDRRLDPVGRDPRSTVPQRSVYNDASGDLEPVRRQRRRAPVTERDGYIIDSASAAAAARPFMLVAEKEDPPTPRGLAADAVREGVVESLGVQIDNLIEVTVNKVHAELTALLSQIFHAEVTRFSNTRSINLVSPRDLRRIPTKAFNALRDSPLTKLQHWYKFDLVPSDWPPYKRSSDEEPLITTIKALSAVRGLHDSRDYTQFFEEQRAFVLRMQLEAYTADPRQNKLKPPRLELGNMLDIMVGLLADMLAHRPMTVQEQAGLVDHINRVGDHLVDIGRDKMYNDTESEEYKSKISEMRGDVGTASALPLVYRGSAVALIANYGKDPIESAHGVRDELIRLLDIESVRRLTMNTSETMQKKVHTLLDKYVAEIPYETVAKDIMDRIRRVVSGAARSARQ